jgi:hypothetical protein
MDQLSKRQLEEFIPITEASPSKEGTMSFTQVRLKMQRDEEVSQESSQLQPRTMR